MDCTTSDKTRPEVLDYTLLGRREGGENTLDSRSSSLGGRHLSGNKVGLNIPSDNIHPNLLHVPAIQFARLSGFSPIITIASRRNELRLKSRGATHVIDRSVPLSRLQRTIKEITDKPLEIIYDAIADPSTQNAAYGALASGGKLILTLDAAIEKEKLTEDKTIVNVFGNVHVPTQREVGVGLYRNLTALLEAGDLKVRTLLP